MITELKYLYHRVYLWLNPNKKLAKIKTLSTNLRSRKKWTLEEVSDLILMYNTSTPLAAIAEELDRPIAGVRSKLISLGYSTRK